MSTSDFQVLPVLDLMRGQVVRGVAGNRAEYQPAVPSPQPVEFVRQITNRFDKLLGDYYVADLDAIQSGSGNVQYHVLRELLSVRPPIRMWVDAGIANRTAAKQFHRSLSNSRCERGGHAALRERLPVGVTIIVASETLQSWVDLESIVADFGSENVVFSLDLFRGQVRGGAAEVAEAEPMQIMERLAQTRVTRMILLDVASVGIRSGLSTLELCRKIHATYPRLQVFTGGGVRTVDDLNEIRNAGCCGALVATSLHDGTVAPADLKAFFIGSNQEPNV